jgi:hypothetical protein
MNHINIVFNYSDFQDYRNWIRLNLESVTWQGNFEKEFEDFWSYFFLDGLTLNGVIERFNYVIAETRIGPLSSWFNWLKERFIIYTFIYRRISLYNLSNESGILTSELSGMIRNFFIEKFPHCDDHFSDFFQVCNVASPNLHLTFEMIVEELGIDDNFYGSSDEDIMPTMEVTLYTKEWNRLLRRMRKDLQNNEFNIKKYRAKVFLQKQFKFIYELMFLVLIAALLISGIKEGNKWYVKYLSNKISIYSTKFFWLDKDKRISENEEKHDKYAFKIDFAELEKINKAEDIERDVEDATFVTESEVILTSWDSVPKDFDTADYEQSDYEEIQKGGYRDTRFGNKKAYRVMINSVDTIKTSNLLKKYLNRYQAIQADKVRPGMEVPGGLYYNLYVPRKYLKEFLAQVMEIDESTLYQSRTRRANPPGKNKVFIWVKNL